MRTASGRERSHSRRHNYPRGHGRAWSSPPKVQGTLLKRMQLEVNMWVAARRRRIPPGTSLPETCVHTPLKTVFYKTPFIPRQLDAWKTVFFKTPCLENGLLQNPIPSKSSLRFDSHDNAFVQHCIVTTFW